MTRARVAELVSCAALCVSAPALAEPSATDASEAAAAWAFSGLAYLYFVPADRSYVQPSFTADRSALHLEARYNYEDMRTASLWVGYNLAGGEELGWTLTPMFASVVGRSNGVAPGCRVSLSYGKFELYSEGEYLFDFGDPAASFFFNWSELGFAPLTWLHAGLVTQRTRAYATTRELQRGLFAGVSFGMATLTTYVLNPDASQPIVIVAASLSSE